MNYIKSIGYNIEDALNPAASVFVSAHAGAGKTSLLTKRVLRLLLSGAAPSKILCLTFTNAAAAEMSGRVLANLGAWVMADSAALANSLAELGMTADAALMARARSLFAQVLESPEGVRIQTIHGFCQSLLRRFPIEAGVSPHFSVIDSRTEQELLQEARLRLFNRAQSEDPQLQQSIAAIATMAGESGLRGMLAQIVAHKRRISAWLNGKDAVENAIQKVWQLLQIPDGGTVSSLIDTYFSYDEFTIAQWRRIVKYLRNGDISEQKTAERLIDWFTNQSDRDDRVGGYVHLFLTKEGKPRVRLHKKSTIIDPDLLELLKEEQERAWRFNDACNALNAAEYTAHMLHVTEAFLALYTKLKEATGRMDYDDLILSACRLLQRSGIAPWVLYKLDGGIDHILVDEAQDTSAEQWSIIDTLTQEFFAGQGRSDIARSLFIVGDEKQSIFSFQGADPTGLARMQAYFSRRIDDAGIPHHRILLDRSYRSTPEVLSSVDAVFAQASAKSGLMAEMAELAHTPTRLEHPGLVEVWPLIRPKEEGDAFFSAHTLLARKLADTIRGWIANGTMLESKGRAVQAGDILILVRTRTKFVDSLVRALKRRNVAVAGHDRMALGKNLAVQDLMALGQVVLLPEDDLTLATVLKSPVFSMNEEELFALAWNRGKQSLWERLQEMADTHRGYSKAHELLTDLRARADFISPFEFYSYLLDTLGARRNITGRMGEEYNDALDEFLGQALLYTRSHPPSLQGFLHWLAASDSDIKRDMEQSKDMVRIMTAHGAKGLQAPIVILPDTVEMPKLRDTLLWYEEEGSSLPFWPVSAAQDDTFCASLRNQQRDAMFAEYRRLLYVALTRAEDRLYICGATSKEKINDGCWYHLVRSGLASIATVIDFEEGEGLRIGINPKQSQRNAESKVAIYSKSTSVDFSFLTQPAPPEPSPTRPLTPSRVTGNELTAISPLASNEIFQRGTLIHQLLQYLPGVPAAERAQISERIALSHKHTLSQTIIDECIGEAQTVMDNAKFAFLFGDDALAEVPVAGLVMIDGKSIAVSGQIDRLHIGEKEVWIVDFKSNRLPPKNPYDIPAAYVCQMRLYQLLLAQIYPQKIVRAALLWTATAAITAIDEAMLDEAPASAYI